MMNRTHDAGSLTDLRTNYVVSPMPSWHGFYLARAKLGASSKTSALLAGFVMVSMVEIHLETDLPQSLLVIFTILTVVVVTVHLTALFISTCIQPHIDAIAGDREGRDVLPSSSYDALLGSPHVALHRYISAAWLLSTGIGILLFLAQMAVVAWVRFHDLSQTAAIVATVIIVPVIIVFLVFTTFFYRQLMSHRYTQVSRKLEELDSVVLTIESSNHRIAHVA